MALAAEAKIGFMGVGNMGEPILNAMIQSGVEAERISFAVRKPDRREALAEKYAIAPSSLEEMAASCEVLVLAIKPQDLESITSIISPLIKPHTLLISILAGKKTSKISELLGSHVRVIRVMPNTPTALGAGMAGVSKGSSATDSDVEFVLSFLKSCGKVVLLPEELQDALAATSGSGPAYIFAFAEAMINGAIELGLNPEIATELTHQTILGAARMLNESGESASTLREKVTSAKGMTFEGLKVLSDGGLNTLVARAMSAARNRSQELAQ